MFFFLLEFIRKSKQNYKTNTSMSSSAGQLNFTMQFNYSHDNITSHGDGALHIDPTFRDVVYVCFVIIFVLGIIGNFVLFFVFHKNRRSKTRTIHVLTLNLACSDLLVLIIYLPMQFYLINGMMQWRLGTIACKAFYGINAATVNANIMTLILITRDRCIAVTDPLTTYSRGLSYVKKALVVTWLIAIALTLPLLIVVDVTNGYCYELWPNLHMEHFYWIALFSLQLVLPLIYFAYAYTLIVFKMQTKKLPQSKLLKENQTVDKRVSHRQRNKRKKQQSKLLKLAIILIVAYVVCVLPQHSVFFAMTYGTLGMETYAIYVFILSNLFLTLNSLVNPVIFMTQNQEVKNAMRQFCCQCKTHFDDWKNYSTKSTDSTTAFV